MFDFDRDSGSMTMFGLIGDFYDGVVIDEVHNGLKSLKGQDVTVRINSDGGDVFQGISMANMLASHEGDVTIVVDGIAASIASVIAAAGDRVQIYENSMIMIHNPWTIAMGGAEEFRFTADLLDKIAGEIAGVYARRSGRDPQQFLDLMQQDTYFTAAEAIEIGLADEIVTVGGKSPAASRDTKPIAMASAFPRRAAATNALQKRRLR